MKNSCILYAEQYNSAMQKLSDNQLGQITRAIFMRLKGEEFQFSDPFSEFAFEFLQAQFNLDDKKYDDVCEKRKIAIEKRWKRNKDTVDTVTPNDKDTDKEPIKNENLFSSEIKSEQTIDNIKPIEIPARVNEPTSIPPYFEQEINEVENRAFLDNGWLEVIQMNLSQNKIKKTPSEIKKLGNQYANQLKADGEDKISMKVFKFRFSRWLVKTLKVNENENKSKFDNSSKQAWRNGIDGEDLPEGSYQGIF